jgi:2-iminoacetate synthase ThiH
MIEIEINTAIAERARGGERLTAAEIEELDSVDVLSLGMLADEVRRARVGDTVTYLRVLDVAGGGLVAGTLTVPPSSCGEVRVATPADTLAATVEDVRLARATVGSGMRLTGFSLADLALRPWGPLRETLEALKAAGLDAITEAPVDLVTADQVAAVQAAGLGPGTLSVQRLPDGGRVAILGRARALLDANPHLTCFAPLAREQSVSTPTTGYSDVRLVALARLALPQARTIAVDWQQYGPKLAQVALTFGANHLDRVAPTDDPALGWRRASVEEVRRNIRAAGFTPVEQAPS